MRIIILGSKGMLGCQAQSYFKKKYLVETFKLRLNEKNIYKFIQKLNKKKPSVVINCIGKIKQKKTSKKNLFFSNSLLPYYFSKYLKKKHLLIHPSTDCVFDGKIKKMYKKNTKYNPVDFYGVTKSFGDLLLMNRTNTAIVRVSIIGYSKTKKDLLTWAINSKKNIFGYSNHYWNGITTLEWCKIVERNIIKKNKINKVKVLQLGTEKKKSKYKLLLIIKKIFNLKYNIIKTKVNYVNRSLCSDIKIKNIYDQLEDLKKYWNL